MDISFHYPPELMNLLVDTIPRLNRSKRDVLLFFQGAGVSQNVLADINQRLTIDKNSINKFEIVRTVLTRLNEKGENALKQRREILKRVVEFDNFSVCWPNDQLKAKGLVAEIRELVNVKDSFTRINLERKYERQKRQKEYKKSIDAKKERVKKLERIKKDLGDLLKEDDPQKRGKKLESVLNDLFTAYDILIKESFVMKGDVGDGIVEQVDGVIKLDNHLYLVEMKWYAKKIGPPEISHHLVRVYSRGEVRGIFISASGYTQAAIKTCTEALHHKVFILCELSEIILALEKEENLVDILRRKVNAATLEKNPLSVQVM